MCVKCILIFVIGLSGVGKTSMIQRFVEENPDYLHLEASKLIKQATGIQVSEKIRLLAKNKIIKNQYILVEELSRYKNSFDKIILDGHLLINNNQELIPIPLDTIRKISPNSMILVEGNANDILLHRKNDLYKTRPNQLLVEIEEEQLELRKIAVKYCNELNIKLDTINFEDYAEFCHLVSKET